MKKLGRWLERPWFAYTFALCCAVILYMILGHLDVLGERISAVWKLISPVFGGIIVAYLLNPVSDVFEFRVFKKLKNENTRHVLAVIVTVLCLVLFLSVILVALVPSLAKSVSKLISDWDTYTQKAHDLIDKVSVFAASKNINVDLTRISEIVDNSMAELVKLLKDNTKPILSALGSVGTSVSNFAIAIVFGVCFLVAEKSLVGLLGKVRAALFRPERLARNNELLLRCHKVFIRYVGCTLLDATIIAIGVLIFTLIMGMPYAGLIAAVCGITNVIPTFGPMIGAAIGIFFLILDKPLNALWFFIFICVWQSVDGMIIKPKLFSGSLGIPAVWTLVLIILGGKVAGMIGILLAIPLAAILVILYRETILPRMEKRTARLNPACADEPQPDDNTPPTNEAE